MMSCQPFVVKANRLHGKPGKCGSSVNTISHRWCRAQHAWEVRHYNVWQEKHCWWGWWYKTWPVCSDAEVLWCYSTNKGVSCTAREVSHLSSCLCLEPNAYREPCQLGMAKRRWHQASSVDDTPTNYPELSTTDGCKAKCRGTCKCYLFGLKCTQLCACKCVDFNNLWSRHSAMHPLQTYNSNFICIKLLWSEMFLCLSVYGNLLFFISYPSCTLVILFPYSCHSAMHSCFLPSDVYVFMSHPMSVLHCLRHGTFRWLTASGCSASLHAFLVYILINSLLVYSHVYSLTMTNHSSHTSYIYLVFTFLWWIVRITY